MKLIGLCCFLFIVTISDGTLVDLSHNYNKSTQHWPVTAKKFEIEFRDFTADGVWFASNSFCTGEHSGTHFDAPYHFNKNGWTAEQIPLDRLFEIPAAIINISERISQNHPPLHLTIEDLKAWEDINGQIPHRALVIMHSGWNKHWFDSYKYYNSTNLDDMKTFSFPGIDPEAALWLVGNRDIVGVGVDSASVDGKGGVKSHQILLGKNIYILENLVNVDKLPAKGAVIYAFPMKIEGGSGGPIRVVAKY